MRLPGKETAYQSTRPKHPMKLDLTLSQTSIYFFRRKTNDLCVCYC
jgi:hypothetical protein